jgi:hypothetical protein
LNTLLFRAVLNRYCTEEALALIFSNGCVSPEKRQSLARQDSSSLFSISGEAPSAPGVQYFHPRSGRVFGLVDFGDLHVITFLGPNRR